MKKFITFFILGSVFLFPRLSSAQIFLEDGKVKLSVSPGENVTGSLMAHNTSDKSIRVKIYWEDFHYEPPYDGTKKFSSLGSTANSCGQWINFSPQEFVFPPFGKQKIDYVLNPPADIHGGYYGVLFFEKEEEKRTGEVGLNVVTRVGSLFFVEAENRTKKAEVNADTFQNNILKASFKNSGDTVLIPGGTFYVMNGEGVVVDRGEIKKYYLPPQGKVDFEAPVSPDLPSGKFTLVITFDLEDGDSSVKEIDFEKEGAATFRVLATRD